MKLYHSALTALLLFALLGAGCAAPRTAPSLVEVHISVDGKDIPVRAPEGGSVQQALELAKLSMGDLDRVEPPSYTPLVPGAKIRVVRVLEKFEVRQEVIPFVQQRQPTELLPEGEVRLDPLQPGESGQREITYRIVFEDGVEVSRSPVKTTIIKDQQPQIMLVGVRPLSAPLSIPGRLVYLVGGNAWMMEGTTANRRPLISTGDLDGRVLSLPSDGSWLLFTRRSQDSEQINSLWSSEIGTGPLEPLDLKVGNVVHFADWVPGSNNRIAYSTVEPRPGAPGWLANDDLNYLTIYKSGPGSFGKVEFKEGIGGSYGWWGVNFTWAPDGHSLAFSNSNGVGLVGTTKEETPAKLADFTPLETLGDWAWVPGVSWGPDGRTLYTVLPSAAGGLAGFDLAAISLAGAQLAGGAPVRLVTNLGMFAYPVASPLQTLSTGETGYQVAYLEAFFPADSEKGPYRLWVMDRDGSNRKKLFPPEGEPGLDPQQVVWSPAPLTEGGEYAIALLYQGSLWMVGVDSGKIQQVTGDEMVSRIAWKGK